MWNYKLFIFHHYRNHKNEIFSAFSICSKSEWSAVTNVPFNLIEVASPIESPNGIAYRALRRDVSEKYYIVDSVNKINRK